LTHPTKIWISWNSVIYSAFSSAFLSSAFSSFFSSSLKIKN
jgi:hypothetical protein